MVKAKRFNLSMALVVVLSVLLTLAISVGATLAWFSDTDFGTTNLTMSGAVLVNLANGEGEYSATTGDDVIFNRPAELLQPGMTITPEVYTSIQGSTTNALVRVKVEVGATWASYTAVPYGWTDRGEGYEGDRYLLTGSEPAVSFNALTNDSTTEVDSVYEYIAQTIETFFLNSIDGSANEAGWYRHNGYYYFFGNGEEYSRLLTARGVAQDGSTPAEDPEYETVANAIGEGANKPTYVTGSTTMLDKLDETKLASVVNASTSNIPFLVAPFEVPTGWGNEVAGATITIGVTVQAMQDYVIDLEDTDGIREQQFPTLDYAIPQFEDAFPTQP